ncbi:MAG: hypothetical protein HYU81_01545 [Candidatus Brennerbacteria bacterium]|nr:hypothetical protein [Candidatus Brennerbacteria bacterium]
MKDFHFVHPFSEQRSCSFLPSISALISGANQSLDGQAKEKAREAGAGRK